jgi:cytosine/adenosine deaminase-related metal-dependent hydrolase
MLVGVRSLAAKLYARRAERSNSRRGHLLRAFERLTLKGSDVDTVIVGVRPVMEERRLLTLDTARIAVRARERQRAVLRSLDGN